MKTMQFPGRRRTMKAEEKRESPRMEKMEKREDDAMPKRKRGRPRKER